MTLQVDTLIAVSLMMAVFSAVAAVGTSLVLGAGFERLRAGFEIISKQTGFFSDVINKLEKKVEKVDETTDSFSRSINTLEEKVGDVGKQTAQFTESVQKLERKVEVVDKQTAFFSDAIHKLEQQVEAIEVATPEDRSGLVSVSKEEAEIQADTSLTQDCILVDEAAEGGDAILQQAHVSFAGDMMRYMFHGSPGKKDEIRFH